MFMYLNCVIFYTRTSVSGSYVASRRNGRKPVENKSRHSSTGKIKTSRADNFYSNLQGPSGSCNKKQTSVPNITNCWRRKFLFIKENIKQKLFSSSCFSRGQRMALFRRIRVRIYASFTSNRHRLSRFIYCQDQICSEICTKLNYVFLQNVSKCRIMYLGRILASFRWAVVLNLG
jgi:hypothetical protein